MSYKCKMCGQDLSVYWQDLHLEYRCSDCNITYSMMSLMLDEDSETSPSPEEIENRTGCKTKW